MKLINSTLLAASLMLLTFSPSWALVPEEVVKLTVEESGNYFYGWSVDVDGDTAVVGAPRQWTENGRGAVYVYTRFGETWQLEQRLVSPDEGAGNDRFGYRVSVSGDRLLVSARFDDDFGDNSGSAYVFTRSAGSWSFQQKLNASDGVAGDQFGLSVSISGDWAFVGTSRDSVDIDGDEIEETFVGSVYVFRNSSGTWSEVAKLQAGDRQDGQSFGGDVALSGDTLVVGASRDNQVADGAGAGYVFTRAGDNWVQQQKLTASDGIAGDFLGQSVSVSGDTIILGAPNGCIEGSDATFTSCIGRDLSAGNKAYVYFWDGTAWVEEAKLVSSTGEIGDFFGIVAVSGSTAVIGADGDDDKGLDAGAAYIFKRIAGVWTEVEKFYASDAQQTEWFGAQVAMDRGTALIAAPIAFAFDGRPGSAYVFNDRNILNNPGFEELPIVENYQSNVIGIPGWFNVGAGQNNAVIGAPSIGAIEGEYALQLSFNDPNIDPENPENNNNVQFVFQQLFLNERLAAIPGEEYYASVRVLRETAPENDALSVGLLGLAFFDDLIFPEIADMAPASISKGEIGLCPYPGINATFDGTESLNAWLQLQAQGVAASADDVLVACTFKVPSDVEGVGLFLFNINDTGAPAPIWFDDVILARLEPDDDKDRIENGVDSDPLNISVDFSDGTTSGSIVSDPDGILGIDDALEAPDGVRIVSDPGNAAPARVRVCDSSATLSIRPNSDVVATCGSVILAVATGSEPVVVEIDFNGEPATIEVPPEVTITYEPEDQTLAVESTSEDPEPVVLTVGDTTVPVFPTSVPGFPVAIDVKPGEYPNCFNINSNGAIPVAILGSDLLDVFEVDPNSLSFGGGTVRVRGSDRPLCGTEDTNLDGFDDLVCQFEDDPTFWSEGVSRADLLGELYDGTVITGSDSICIVP
jgi:hypothetical protein